MTSITSTITRKFKTPNIEDYYGPYTSVGEAHSVLSSNAVGLNIIGYTVGIQPTGSNTITEYWYQGGTGENNLVEKNTGGGGYAPPAGGIPKGDLSSDVQASLDKADAAAPQNNTYSIVEVNDIADGLSTSINTAKTEIIGNASAGYDTLGEVETAIKAEEARAKAAESDTAASIALVDSNRQIAEARLQSSVAQNRNNIALMRTTINQMNQSVAQLDGHDVVVVDELPASPDANVIYRLITTDGDDVSYEDYMYNEDDLTTPIKVATYALPGIDEEATKDSEKLLTSGSVFKAIQNDAIYDISVNNAIDSTPIKYPSLADALQQVPSDYQVGGINIKFIKDEPAYYRVELSTSDTAPSSGTIVSPTVELSAGDYVADDIPNSFTNLPTVGNSKTYYALEVEDAQQSIQGYKIWTITKIANDTSRYVQYRLMNPTWSTNVAKWQGVINEVKLGSKDFVDSDGVAKMFNLFIIPGHIGKNGNFYGNSQYIRTDYIPIIENRQYNVYNIYEGVNDVAACYVYDEYKSPLGEIFSEKYATFSDVINANSILATYPTGRYFCLSGRIDGNPYIDAPVYEVLKDNGIRYNDYCYHLGISTEYTLATAIVAVPTSFRKPFSSIVFKGANDVMHYATYLYPNTSAWEVPNAWLDANSINNKGVVNVHFVDNLSNAVASFRFYSLQEAIEKVNDAGLAIRARILVYLESNGEVCLAMFNKTAYASDFTNTNNWTVIKSSDIVEWNKAVSNLSQLLEKVGTDAETVNYTSDNFTGIAYSSVREMFVTAGSSSDSIIIQAKDGASYKCPSYTVAICNKQPELDDPKSIVTRTVSKNTEFTVTGNGNYLFIIIDNKAAFESCEFVFLQSGLFKQINDVDKQVTSVEESLALTQQELGSKKIVNTYTTADYSGVSYSSPRTEFVTAGPSTDSFILEAGAGVSYRCPSYAIYLCNKRPQAGDPNSIIVETISKNTEFTIEDTGYYLFIPITSKSTFESCDLIISSSGLYKRVDDVEDQMANVEDAITQIQESLDNDDNLVLKASKYEAIIELRERELRNEYQNKVADGYVGKWYGVEWTEESNPDNVVPINSTGDFSLHTTLPIQSKMRRCVTKDNIVQYYLDANNSELKADGTSANLDGTDGNVMVEIPEFFYKIEEEMVNGVRKIRIKLSEDAFPDFLFSHKRYTSAYEATINRNTGFLASVCTTEFSRQDSETVKTNSDSYIQGTARTRTTGKTARRNGHTANAATYRGGTNDSTLDQYETPSDENYSRNQLGLPVANINRMQVRAACAEDQFGYLYDTQKLLYLLIQVEFKTRNIQKSISNGGLGVGATQYPSYSAYEKFFSPQGGISCIPCGVTNSLGNNSGEVYYLMENVPTSYVDSTYTFGNVWMPCMSYRGVEHYYGHLYKIADQVDCVTGPTTGYVDGHDGDTYYSKHDVSWWYEKNPYLVKNIHKDRNLLGTWNFACHITTVSSLLMGKLGHVLHIDAYEKDYSKNYCDCCEIDARTGKIKYITFNGRIVSQTLVGNHFIVSYNTADEGDARPSDGTRLDHF